MPEPGPDPQQALDRLLAGNTRWVAGAVTHPHQSPERRAAIASDQAPFATVFSCGDSRVPAELVFDCGLGDLFVVRTAGHAIDDVVLASIEFGAAVLGTPLIAVLGHERCGAVTATIRAAESGEQPSGRIASIVHALRPAYERAAGEAADDLVDATVRAQTALTVEQLAQEPPLRERVEAGTLAIVGARYDLDTGRVDVIA